MTMAKTYLSQSLALLCVVSFSVLGISAQVHPRSEAAQEQREEKAPLKDSDFITAAPLAVFQLEQDDWGHSAIGLKVMVFGLNSNRPPKRFPCS